MTMMFQSKLIAGHKVLPCKYYSNLQLKSARDAQFLTRPQGVLLLDSISRSSCAHFFLLLPTPIHNWQLVSREGEALCIIIKLSIKTSSWRLLSDFPHHPHSQFTTPRLILGTLVCCLSSLYRLCTYILDCIDSVYTNQITTISTFTKWLPPTSPSLSSVDS